MARKIQDIQEIINQRASEKLNADLVAMSQTISNLKLLRDMNDGQRPTVYDLVTPDKAGAEPYHKEFKVTDIFNAYDHRGELQASLWMKRLRAYWLTEYIQRETKDFFEKVDKLESDVAELLTGKYNQHDD